MKQKPKKIYKIINLHPTYDTEEEKQKSYKEIALNLALEADRLRKLYPHIKI